jgi:N-sulfoglucosamine sulfohydrolase
MTRRDFAKRAAAAAATRVRTSGAASRPPNILLITADDLGPMLGCYGETRIRTPHLDKLASTGVQFRTAYITQASCSPSRSSIFTGLYPHGTGQYGLANTGFSLHPYLRSQTIPALLNKSGYRTGILGKLHVEPEASFPFDERIKVSSTRHVRDIAARAGAFLEQSKSAPFFLMVNYSDPHAFRRENNPNDWYFPPQVDGLPAKPIPPGPQTVWPFQQIDSPAQRERVANYYNAVMRLDDGIGMLMERLERAELAENTVVIFLGDHGPPFDRGKTSCYDAALRVPFLVRWPGVSKAMKSDAMVSSVDILPTILDAVGISIPTHVQGRSLRPVLSDARARWREYLAGEFHCHGAAGFFPRRTIRDGRYKLIRNLLAGKAKPRTGIDADIGFTTSREPRYDNTPVRRAFDTFADPPEYELYDLQEDPVEFRNLAGTPRAAAAEKRMAAALENWRNETKDPFLDPAYTELVANLTAAERSGDSWRP